MKEEIEKKIEELNNDLVNAWESHPEKKEEIGKRLAFLNAMYNALYNNFY